MTSKYEMPDEIRVFRVMDLGGKKLCVHASGYEAPDDVIYVRKDRAALQSSQPVEIPGLDEAISIAAALEFIHYDDVTANACKTCISAARRYAAGHKAPASTGAVEDARCPTCGFVGNPSCSKIGCPDNPASQNGEQS